MILTTALNMVWALIALIALGLFCKYERARGRLRWFRFGGGSRLIAVLLVILSLFPCVSASDDLLGFSFLSVGLSHRGSYNGSVPDNAKDQPSVQLLRVLQSLEHIEFRASFVWSCVFLVLGTIVYSRQRAITRLAARPTGRGPPSLLPA